MIPIERIREAAGRIRGLVARTPLLALERPEVPDGPEIYLKLEVLQPIGSFKIRGATNLLESLPRSELDAGVWTPSAGNMAQAAAYAARRLGIPCTVLVPDNAPATKLRSVERLGGSIVKLPFDRWWQVFEDRDYPGVRGTLVHPFDDELVMAGNGTIGLEILEDLPDADTILVPWGGGGLASGIASAVRALRPGTRIFAAEVATAAPLSASLAAGEARKVPRIPTFVDGIGGSGVFPRMFERARELLDGALLAEVAQIEDAVRVLVERVHIVAEGAGACPVALALSGRAPGRKIVCVVSGGNLDAAVLARILRGEPSAEP
jgi:threonine dehydratase